MTAALGDFHRRSALRARQGGLGLAAYQLCGIAVGAQVGSHSDGNSIGAGKDLFAALYPHRPRAAYAAQVLHEELERHARAE